MDTGISIPATVGEPAVHSWVSQTVTVVLSLAVIVGVLIVLSKWMMRKRHLFQANRSLRIVASIVLAPQKTVHVVEIGTQLYVIGVGQDVTLLDKVTDRSSWERVDDAQEEKSFFPWAHGYQRTQSVTAVEHPLTDDTTIRAIVENKLRHRRPPLS